MIRQSLGPINYCWLTVSQPGNGLLRLSPSAALGVSLGISGQVGLLTRCLSLGPPQRVLASGRHQGFVPRTQQTAVRWITRVSVAGRTVEVSVLILNDFDGACVSGVGKSAMAVPQVLKAVGSMLRIKISWDTVDS